MTVTIQELDSLYRKALEAMADFGTHCDRCRSENDMTQGDFDAICKKAGMSLPVLRIARKEGEKRNSMKWYGGSPQADNTPAADPSPTDAEGSDPPVRKTMPGHA